MYLKLNLVSPALFQHSLHFFNSSSSSSIIEIIMLYVFYFGTVCFIKPYQDPVYKFAGSQNGVMKWIDWLEVIWPHHDQKWDLRWPPWPQQWLYRIQMKKDFCICKVIVVVMEVIWGHIFGHVEVKWPPIGLKHLKVEYWSHYHSFDMSLDMG